MPHCMPQKQQCVSTIRSGSSRPGNPLAPYYRKGRDPDPAGSARLSAVRYQVETVNGQLAERFPVKRTWARDLWHLCHRVIRKVLSHTVSMLMNVRAGHAPLQFAALAA